MTSNSPQARRKRHSKENLNLPLPIFHSSDGQILKFNATFNGFSIIVTDAKDMINLYLNGCFGKGTLSRSYPNFIDKTKTSIIRKRQMDNRKQWTNISSNTRKDKVIVVPDSDSDNEDYFKNLQPTFELDSSNLKEELALSLEEAYFLLDSIKCLNIFNNNENLTSNQAWSLFEIADKHFIENYIAYYYFKSRNWVVKPGLKFGGDYLLYKDGPQYYHASYVVILDVIQEETLDRIENRCRRSMNINDLIGLHRLCENVGKELLICQILWPNVKVVNSEQIKDFTINNILFKRWILPNELENNC